MTQQHRAGAPVEDVVEAVKVERGGGRGLGRVRVLGGAPALGLQRVPEPPTGKNRVHIDLETDDRAGEVARLVGLGATVLGEHEAPGLAWTVLADPDGNEFCVAIH